MTDKQEIDVTKCIHFDKSDIPNGCTCYWDGECNHHCYYKKYVYKHQECEELKTILKDLSCENQKFCYQIKEQTKQLEPFKDEYFKGLDNVVIAELAKKSIRITAENSKLEQTLTEIKEIAEENIRIADSEGLNGVYRRGLAKQILQKIS